MKTYRFYKTVHALKITKVQNAPPSASDPRGLALELTLEDGSQVYVDGPQFAPTCPGYYFVREFDGQTSVLHPTTFEHWHTEVLGSSQIHDNSMISPRPSRPPHDPADCNDHAQLAALRMDAERRTRREDFDWWEKHGKPKSRNYNPEGEKA